MTLERDSADCLIEAIGDAYNVGISAEQLNTVKPSDSELGAKTDIAWRTVLGAAAQGLRQKGHQVGDPTRRRAGELLDAELVHSQLYLEELVSSPKLGPSHFLIAGGVAAGAAAIALAVARRDQAKRR